MGAKVRADRRSQHAEPLVAVEPPLVEAELDADFEADVRAAAVWFEALPPELQRYFDHEALHGRGAYPSNDGGAPSAALGSAPKPPGNDSAPPTAALGSARKPSAT
jgi:hypothetical protein